jgi:ABC-type uncharacterized transport system auxiliary subunit
MSQPRRLLIPVLLGLSGCGSLLHSTAPALQLYVLQPPPIVAATAPAAAPTLTVARALPGPGLNTDRIALLRPGNRLDYYAGSRWSAPLNELLSDLQLTVLRTDSAWSAVADDRSTFNADYLLQTSIDQFTAEYATEAGPPLIRVDLHCLLIRRSDGVLLGSFAVSQSEAAQANRMASVIAAFSQAADRAVIAVAGQAAQLLRSAKSPAPP